MKNESFKDFVLDQLRDLDLSCRSMSGGYALYAGQNFFAFIFDGQLFFRTNAKTKPAFVEAGMRPFEGKKQNLKNYYAVPPHVVDDREILLQWAQQAIET